jgi:hypothetical protein
MTILGVALLVLAGDKEDVANAAKKTSEAGSYKFTADIESQMAQGGNPFNVEGFYKKDEGAYAKVGDRFEVAKKGDRIVYTDQDGTWKILEAPKGGNNRGRGMDPRSFAKMIKAPHEELKGIESKFDKLSKDEKTERYEDVDCSVYSGTLTDEGVRTFVPMGDQLKKWGDPEIKGSAKIYVNPDGAVIRYRIDVEMNYEFNGQQFPVNFSRDIKLSRLDNVQDELPRDAKELLTKEIPSEDKPKDEEKKKDE